MKGLHGEALSAFGADCAGKEGFAALPDYRRRRCGPPGRTLIEKWESLFGRDAAA